MAHSGSKSKSKAMDLGGALLSLSEVLSVGDKVMLAVAWSREDECQLFEKFPEVRYRHMLRYRIMLQLQSVSA